MTVSDEDIVIGNVTLFGLMADPLLDIFHPCHASPTNMYTTERDLVSLAIRSIPIATLFKISPNDRCTEQVQYFGTKLKIIVLA